MKHVTIRDIAEAARVSPGAVSFALNNKPGVSEATRQRIIDTATRMGWSPNPAARALSASRTGSIGLVLTRPAQTIREESFYFSFICGVADSLSTSGNSFVLRMTHSCDDELSIYREWKASRTVDGVILLDLATDDPRPLLLKELEIPFVCVGGDCEGGSSLLIDDAEAMRRIVTHVFAQGFRHPVYVSGIRGVEHTAIRQRAFAQSCAHMGLEGVRTYMSDYTEDTGAAITRSIMESTPNVDMIIYDNEILTLGGMAYLRAHGIDVPGQIGIFSWEDSPLCRVLSPAISSLTRDSEQLGIQAAEVILSTVESEKLIERHVPTPAIVARASTAMRGTKVGQQGRSV